jgi:signal transduction histidine kinase
VAPNEHVDLDRVVRSVLDEHPDGRVQLGTIEPVVVAGDADQLRRVVSNLVDNGLVHGPDGGVVTVSITAEDGSAQVSVRDMGAGPDPAQRDQLFERFWRSPESAGRPGSGLGLSIVAAIVERHRGTIRVDGAEFVVTLPTIQVPPAIPARRG